MKKNRMMRLASILLVCVLLTTSVISGTFAKYTTSFTTQDSARVAKWGFNDATLTIDLFASTYDHVNGKGDDVIAPGTEGETTIVFVPQGMAAPEVAYKIIVDTNGSSIHSNIDTNPNIIWYFDGVKCDSWNDLLDSIANLSTATIEANTYDSNFKDGTEHKIAWKWIFDEEADNAEIDTVNNDGMDTNMGNGAADDSVQTALLVINIKVEQVD